MQIVVRMRKKDQSGDADDEEDGELDAEDEELKAKDAKRIAWEKELPKKKLIPETSKKAMSSSSTKRERERDLELVQKCFHHPRSKQRQAKVLMTPPPTCSL